MLFGLLWPPSRAPAFLHLTLDLTPDSTVVPGVQQPPGTRMKMESHKQETTATSPRRRTGVWAAVGAIACVVACVAGTVGLAGAASAAVAVAAGWWWMAIVLMALTIAAVAVRLRTRRAASACGGSCSMPSERGGCGCAPRT